MTVQAKILKLLSSVLTSAIFASICFFSVNSYAEEIDCDPNIRNDNQTCPNGKCRRLGGSCGWFGSLNWMCIDNPNRTESTALGPGFCAGLCANSRGACETNISPCNADIDCDNRESCLNGVCSVGECLQSSDCDGGEICSRNTCNPPPPPECSVDTDCQSDELCFGGQCVLSNCRGDFECRTDERCQNNQCTSRCPAGQTWVPNPIGYPPIPLGRCQPDGSLIDCCRTNGLPLGLTKCPIGTTSCPVGFLCASTSVCFNICGAGPCPDELPQRPREVPSPDKWWELVPNTRIDRDNNRGNGFDLDSPPRGKIPEQ